MEGLTQDVNIDGQGQPPVEYPSSQETDNTNIATQDGHGGVINDDQKSDRDYKNKWVEADRKNQILEEKLKFQTDLMYKFQPGAQAQPLSQIQQHPVVQSSAEQVQKDLELFRISEQTLAELEQTPEGALRAAGIRADRQAALSRKAARDEEVREQRIYDKFVTAQTLEKITSECPELDNPVSPQRQAFMAEYNDLPLGTKNLAGKAYALAKANNPSLFKVVTLKSVKDTRSDSLAQHSVGNQSPGAAAARNNKNLLDNAGVMITTQFFRNDAKAVNERLAAIRKQRGAN
ncbi:MAG: hypothetical protein ABIB11_04360 [Candidatus Omnitrophota bacterium]